MKAFKKVEDEIKQLEKLILSTTTTSKEINSGLQTINEESKSFKMVTHSPSLNDVH